MHRSSASEILKIQRERRITASGDITADGTFLGFQLLSARRTARKVE
jgi:hypothetical protein